MTTVISFLSSLFFSAHLATTEPKSPPQNPKVATTTSHTADINSKAQRLSYKAPQIDKKVLTLALRAYQKAHAKGAAKKPVLTVIDYSMPSHKQRLWVFDVQREKLLYNTHVAHGKNSGPNNVPRNFSNAHSSKQSSLGTYVTRGTYIGSKGYSLNLQGLERGINDNAYNRRVVMHGAWYVEPSFIRKAGRAGLSWGCPAIAASLAKPVINTIKNGSVLFAYYPDRQFLARSGFVNAYA